MAAALLPVDGIAAFTYYEVPCVKTESCQLVICLGGVALNGRSVLPCNGNYLVSCCQDIAIPR